MSDKSVVKSMEEFVAWAKRRGVIWQSSEIYGGLGSSYDYGPVGVEMKNRLKAAWWKTMVQERDDIVGLDSAIILNPKVWEASGHTDSFTDPLVEDLVTHKRYRLDQLKDQTKSPDGNPLSEPKSFNLLFKTFIGPVEDSQSVAYLRGETCQGIFVNFKQIYEVSRQKIPFGIAQIGKSFRNEITPGNFTYRTREFEQMEMEFFVKPDEADKWYQKWIDARLEWYVSLGVKRENLRLYKHPKADLAHYSKGTTDIEYKFPWGWGELEGIANRGDFDLTAHQKHSGKDMSVFDEETKTKFIPWVIEPAGGVDRALLAILLDSWQHFEKGRKADGEAETLLSITPKLAAYDAAVLPLVKKEPLVKVAKELVQKLRGQGKNVFYDESGSIGRRYRRQDEIGTPFCYTVDFETVEAGDNKNTVTVRHRDTMEQERIALELL
jgi:glycyl-tRNA synthetase